MSRKTPFIVSACLVAMFGTVWLYASLAPSEKTTVSGEQRTSPELKSEIPVTTPLDSPKVPDATDSEAFTNTLARELATEFGSRIEEIAIQARLFMIRKDVIKRFPAKGLGYFNDAVQLAFPEHAQAILALLEKLEEYNAWLVAENLTLMNLSALNRHGMIWDKRHELFADKAELIWADERDQLAKKQQAVQDILARLNQDNIETLDEKLHQLKTGLTETFDGELKALVQQEGMITQVFFSLDSVQQSLEAMPATDRQEEIDRIRRQMGYSESQIKRLRQRDTEKNQRWNNGKNYMTEREQVLSDTSGEARQTALDKLRQRYFGDEARTIRMEEEQGFFRYQRPRIYGRN